MAELSRRDLLRVSLAGGASAAVLAGCNWPSPPARTSTTAPASGGAKAGTGGAKLQNLPAFLEASCADLTPYLSGDNIKAYSNLANFPSFRWPYAVFKNKILTISAASATGPALLAKQSVLDTLAVTGFKDKDDF